jgi:hypothetical protein
MSSMAERYDRPRTLPSCPVRAPRALPALAVAALLAGCGGGDFSGAASVPSGYEKYSRDGVSIAYPKGWKVDRRQDSDGGSSTEITPPDHATTPYGLILLSATPHAEKRFETLLKGRRTVMKTADAKVASDEEVDVPHTKEAHRLKATVPPGDGTDPVKVRSDSLDLLRDDGAALTVVVAAPQRKGDDDLDPAKVIESVRLSG